MVTHRRASIGTPATGQLGIPAAAGDDGITQRDRDYHLARRPYAPLIHHELAHLHADRVYSTIEGALPDPASHTGRLQGAAADVSLIDC